jgi:hypothetical protein
MYWWFPRNSKLRNGIKLYLLCRISWKSDRPFSHGRQTAGRTDFITNSVLFFGAFTKLLKATISFFMTVCLSPSVRLCVRMEQLSSLYKDFHKILYLSIFLNLSRKFSFLYHPTKTMNNLHKDQYTCLIISHSALLRMRNVSEKFVEKIKTHFICHNFFRSRAFYEMMWKNIAESGRPQMTI